MDEDKKLKRDLEKTKKQVEFLKKQIENQNKYTENVISKLNEELEDYESEAILSTPMPEPNKKKDYEQKTEKSASYNDYLYKNAIFGWEKIKEFSYKGGGYRFTMRRNMNDPNYAIWKENEKLFSNLYSIKYALYFLEEKIGKLKVTFKDMAAKPEYKLSGWRKFFRIRTKEQIKEIKSKVDEVNKAYDNFKKDIKDVINYIYEKGTKGGFLKDLENNNGKVHRDKDFIIWIMQKYKIHNKNGQTTVNLVGINYDFSEKKIELVEEE